MSPRLLASLGIFVVTAATVAILVLARPVPKPAPEAAKSPLVNMSVVPAKRGVFRIPVVTQGTVQPKRQIDLVAQVSGQIVSVQENFVEGGFFGKGDILVQIDDSDYKIALLEAKARLAEAEQGLAEEEGRALQARREWRDLGDERANALFKRIPQLAAARANFASAEGAVAMAELNLARTRVSVPFDGRVQTLQADLGQFVSRGSVLATVYDSSFVDVRLPLTEKQSALVDLPLVPRTESSEQAASVTIYASIAGQKHQWQGTLTRTDAVVDTQSRMFHAVVEVADPFRLGVNGAATPADQAPLLPGLFVEAKISGKPLQDVISLPRSALYEHDKLVIIDQQNKAKQVQVEVLQRRDDIVWVRADLADDTLVAIDKQSLVSSGTEVLPVVSDIHSIESETSADVDAQP